MVYKDRLLSLSLQVCVCKTQSWVQAGGEWEHGYSDGGQPCCHGLGWGVATEVILPSLHPRLPPGKLLYKRQKQKATTKQTIIRPCPGIHEGAVEIRVANRSLLPVLATLHSAWCRNPRNNMRPGQGTLSFKDSVPCETMDISGTWPPFCRNKYLRSHTLFLFS